jgi:hypothetical protein
LRDHRSPQIHNHEVKISAALGILGFVLEDDTLLEFAVNQPYGLRWQLEHGLLAEGLWFEGSVHYHYYALQGFSPSRNWRAAPAGACWTAPGIRRC